MQTECIGMSTYEFIVRRRESEHKKQEQKQRLPESNGQIKLPVTIRLAKCWRSSLCSVKRWFTCGWLRRNRLNSTQNQPQIKSNDASHQSSGDQAKVNGSKSNVSSIEDAAKQSNGDSTSNEHPAPSNTSAANSRGNTAKWPSHRPLHVQFSSQSECSDEITRAANRMIRLSAQRSLDLKDRNTNDSMSDRSQMILPEVLGQVYLGSPRKRFLEELQVLAKLNDRSSLKAGDPDASIGTLDDDYSPSPVASVPKVNM